MRITNLILIISLLTPAALAFIAEGNVTLSYANGYDKSGFLFNKGEITGINGDIYYYNNKLWTNGPNGLIKIDGFGYCPTTGYYKSIKPVIGLYCVKCNDNSYAIINITRITGNSITFNWFHQRNNTNYFFNDKQSSNINVWLIVLIIILIILLIKEKL